MADRNKLLFINTSGYPEESPVTDSLKYASFKTDNYELSDTLLGKLVNAIVTSAGAGDAGKFVKTDAEGNIDATLINDADIDHGNLTGKADDDHTQYTLADGTRAFTGKVSYSAHPSFSDDKELIDKKYVDDLVTGSEWQDSALDYVTDNTQAPATEVEGDRYILSHDGGSPHADYDGASAGDIVEFNGSTWDAITPTTGMIISADDETDGIYLWTGSAWTKKYYESTTASLGCEKVGVDIRLDLLSGGGLKLTGNEVGIEPNDFAGEGLKDDGSDNMAIDWSTAFNDSKAVKASDLASTSNGYGASIIGVEDSGSFYTATDIEGILAEIAGIIQDEGVDFTVGTGGVDKGDLCYISANDTILPYSTLSETHYGIGLAKEDKDAAQTVRVLDDGEVITGILSTATAGDRYFWTGSAHSSTIPSSSGAYVWQTGVAKNASDLLVSVKLVKKNA